MAATFTLEPQQIAFVDSPQFVTVYSDGLSGLATTVTIEIRLWRDDKIVPPGIAQRTLTLPATVITGNESEATFEISSFLLAYLDFEEIPTTTFGSAQYNEDAAAWFNVECYTDVDTGETTDAALATVGVGDYRGGFNPGTTQILQDGKVFGERSVDLTFDNTLDYIIPVYIGDGSSNSEIQTSIGDLDFVLDYGLTKNSADARKQIAYISFGTSQAGFNAGIKYWYKIENVTSTSAQLTYYGDVECGNRPKSLKYINRFGAVDELPINGSDRETINTIKSEYQNLKPFYANETHVQKTYVSNAETVVSLFTGWMAENTSAQVAELLTSKRVWYQFEGQIYPCSILSNGTKFINRTYDKQIGYELVIKLAQPELNKAR